MHHELSDWKEICQLFKRMFHSLGDVSASANSISFTSHNHLVMTSVSITSDGDLIATMPLHGVESKFDRIFFSPRLDFFEVNGPNFQYKYKIPSELLNSRIESID